MEKRRAIFFDRDNTLNQDPLGYIGDWRQICPMPHARPIVQRALQAGYLLFLITNQSGVGRGYFSIEAVRACNRRLEELLGGGQIFTEIGIATGLDAVVDPCRKPSPKFLKKMCARHGLVPENCWVVGDGAADMAMARRSGARGILVHGEGTVLDPDDEKACLGRYSNLDSAWKLIGKCDGLARIAD
ncbi:MAG: HAD-IIIA family hydrolase [Puniceicoccales bacterium]|nr:HAD-IIIA family hydrolase [Puniceicoccales bacterium]